MEQVIPTAPRFLCWVEERSQQALPPRGAPGHQQHPGVPREGPRGEGGLQGSLRGFSPARCQGTKGAGAAEGAQHPAGLKPPPAAGQTGLQPAPFPGGGLAPRCSNDPGRGRAARSLLSSLGAAGKLQQVPSSSSGHLPLRFSLRASPAASTLPEAQPESPWCWGALGVPAGAGTLLCPEQRVPHQQSATGAPRLRAGCSWVLPELRRERRMLRGPGPAHDLPGLDWELLGCSWVGCPGVPTLLLPPLGARSCVCALPSCLARGSAPCRSIPVAGAGSG